MKRFYVLLIALSLMGFNVSVAQVTLSQFTTDDFMNGTGYNVNIADNSVSLQSKMTSVNDWEATTNLPQNLKNHQIVTWRNYVYCVGGYNGSSVVNTVYRATQQTTGISGWTTLNALPVALQDMAVVATQFNLIVMGGRNAEGVSDKIYMAPLNSGSIGAWTTLELTLPQPLWGARAIVVHDNIYLIGGAPTDSENDASNKVYCLKLNAIGEIASLVEVNNLPEARNGHAVATYDSKIYVTGGYDANHTLKPTVYCATVQLNGTLSSWQQQTEIPVAICNHTSVCTNGMLAILGGWEGDIPSNKFYYANPDDAQFTWGMASTLLSERTRNGVAFAFGDKIFYSGGQNLSGAVVNYVRYAAINVGTEKVTKSVFVSYPMDFGTPKTIQQFNYSLSYVQSTSTYEVLYRLADNNKVFGNWISAGTNNPVVINQNKSFIQYMFRLTSTASDNMQLNEVSFTIPGYTQLSGNLNDMTVLTLANSPYWVTQDISFTGGMHNVEAGVTILFSPNTGLTVGQASVNFYGTASNPISLTYMGNESGRWNGVYYQDASDASVASMMNYTIIDKAGNNSWNANLYLYSTSQPSISNCSFLDADGYGIRLENSSPSIFNSSISNNAESGIYLNNSNPNLNTNDFNGNGYAGLYFANNCNPTFTSCTAMDNQFGLYSYTPDRSFVYNDNDLSIENNEIDIAMAGGRVASNQTWNKFGTGYYVMGDLEIWNPTLTIAPGNTIRIYPGRSIYVGRNSNEPGAIYAVGTPTDSIVFTSYNGEVGGWTGFQFRDGSDFNCASSLRYCKVEKATRNIYSVNTTQPGIMWCTIQDAVNDNIGLESANVSMEESVVRNGQYGIVASNSQPTLVSDVFDGQTVGSIWHNNTGVSITYYDCVIRNSKIGVRYSTPDRHVSSVSGLSFVNNESNWGLPGGTITDSRLWMSDSYAILGTINVARANTPCRLTLSPGSTFRFDQGVQFRIADGNYGELYAEGTEDQPILFTSRNGEIGGWEGIRFYGRSDDLEGMSNSMKYCIVEKGNEYNMMTDGTRLPEIENCEFRYAVSKGLYFNNEFDRTIKNTFIHDNGTEGIYGYRSSFKLQNCQVSNNGANGVHTDDCLLELHDVELSGNQYGMYYNNAHYIDTLQNVTFSNNLYDGVAFAGGNISRDVTWFKLNDGIYYALNSFSVYRGGWNDGGPHVSLTLKPGTTILFNEGCNLQISAWSSSSYNYYGALIAEGTEEEPIYFGPRNGERGGWNGLFFHDLSDNLSGQVSSLKHCIIEKGNEYNLRVDNNQPALIENCAFNGASYDGVQFNSSGARIKNCTFDDNGRHGINSNNSNVRLFTAQVSNSGDYGMYYNNAHYIDTLQNVTFNNNQFDGVAFNGGTISENRTWFKLNNGSYRALNAFCVQREGDYSTLTLKPGVRILFDEGAYLRISEYGNYYNWTNYHYGALIAEGTEEDPIYFGPRNGERGGWNGIYFHDISDDLSGQVSSLKHCVIEKGNEYNLRIDNNQPALVENCKIIDAQGKGIILNSSTSALSKTVVRNNGNNGIYITGSQVPTIGGSYVTGCDIFDNDTVNHYNIYQDGSGNINMPYNYVGSIDSTYIDKHLVYDKMDNSGKGRVRTAPQSWLPMNIGTYDADGFLMYDGKSYKPMSGTVMQLKDFHGDLIDEVTVNSSGYFSFEDVDVNVANKVEFTTPINYADAITSVSALLVKRHFAQLETLTGNHAVVADVNGNGTINGTDALLIQRHAAHITNTFSVGDFYVGCDTLAYDESSNTFNLVLNALCYGDVDGRLNNFRDNGFVVLTHEGNAVVDSNQEVEIPVVIESAESLGAITLRLAYPEDCLSIDDVVLMHGENLMFHAEEGKLSIAWAELNPAVYQAGEVMLLIKAHTRDLSGLESPIAFEINGYSELDDVDANELMDITLSVPSLVTAALGINDQMNAASGFKVYPNPTKGSMMFTYVLPGEGRVTMSLYNAMGVKVKDIADMRQEGGRHELRINDASLSAGVYYCRMVFEGAADWIETIKVVVE